MSSHSRKIRFHEGREFEIVPCQSGYFVAVDGVDMRHFYTRFGAWRFMRRLIRHQAEANSLDTAATNQESSPSE